MDIDSRSEPGRAAAFAERVGIPLHFIDLGRDRIALPNRADPDGDGAGTPLMRTARSADHVLRMRRQARRSGGRLFRIDPELPPAEFLGGVQEVFDRIREDLRRRQVLTYYTSRPIGGAVGPEVEAVGPGLTLKSVLPLDRVDASTGPDADPAPLTGAGGATEYTYRGTDPLDDAPLPVSGRAEDAPARGATVASVPDRRADSTEEEPEQRPAGDLTVLVEGPSFGGATIADRTWVQNEALAPLTFPAASGGKGSSSTGWRRPCRLA